MKTKQIILINQDTFPDPHFREYIEQTIDQNQKGYLYAKEAAAVTKIMVDKKHIRDLSGLEYFPSLERLDCVGNLISTLNLKHNPKLRTLHCTGNPLIQLDISNNSVLALLNCSNTQLTSLDISNNPNLKILHCSYNHLTDLDVRNNPNINVLVCMDNPLESIHTSHKIHYFHYPANITIDLKKHMHNITSAAKCVVDES